MGIAVPTTPPDVLASNSDPLTIFLAADDEKQLRELETRYQANLWAAASALDAARRDPWVQGSTGQRKAHPGFAVAARCDELALRYARELGELRRSLGREDAHDPF